MEKKPIGISVYAIIFIFIGLLVCLGIVQSLVISNMRENMLKEYYAKRLSPGTTNVAAAAKSNPEDFVENLYKMQVEVMKNTPMSIIPYVSFCLNMLLVVIGIGILIRQKWALKSIFYLLVTLIITLIIGNCIYVVKALPIIKKYFGNLPFSGTIMLIINGMIVFFAVVYMIFYISALYYFSIPKIREQFK